MPRIILVACAASKQDAPTEARALYTSDLFTKSRAWAEREVAAGRADAWFILSAEHGLVAPRQVLAPYNTTLNAMTPAARRRWAADVWAQLGPALVVPTTLVFLAGEHYRASLAKAALAAGHGIEVPMRGLGIGQQKAWLKAVLAAA